uniref:ARAD1C20812p n=1 Tax=Blastobotrys adeninivorans TaxID=409370 RepID=A0A060T7D5_BLAAD
MHSISRAVDEAWKDVDPEQTGYIPLSKFMTLMDLVAQKTDTNTANLLGVDPNEIVEKYVKQNPGVDVSRSELKQLFEQLTGKPLDTQILDDSLESDKENRPSLSFEIETMLSPIEMSTPLITRTVPLSLSNQQPKAPPNPQEKFAAQTIRASSSTRQKGQSGPNASPRPSEETEEQMKYYEQQLESLHEERNQLQSAVNTLNTELTTLQSANSSKDAHIKAIEDQLTELQRQLEAQNASSKKVETHGQTIKLRATIRELTGQVDSLRQEKEGLASKLAQQGDKVSNVDNKLRQLEKEREELVEKHQTLAKRNAELDAQRLELETKLSEQPQKPSADLMMSDQDDLNPFNAPSNHPKAQNLFEQLSRALNRQQTLIAQFPFEMDDDSSQRPSAKPTAVTFSSATAVSVPASINMVLALVSVLLGVAIGIYCMSSCDAWWTGTILERACNALDAWVRDLSGDTSPII